MQRRNVKTYRAREREEERKEEPPGRGSVENVKTYWAQRREEEPPGRCNVENVKTYWA